MFCPDCGTWNRARAVRCVRCQGDLPEIASTPMEQPDAELSALRKATGGRYRVVRRLGSGGMAHVYYAMHAVLDRPSVIKVLHQHLARDEEMRERFRREAEAACQLVHPHICSIVDYAVVNDAVYIVMPYFAGGSLADILVRDKTVAGLSAAAIAGQVATALDYAHRRGIIHRDIKPANILCEASEALLTDFGIAWCLGEGSGRAGTPAYMAPEAFAGQVTPKMDVYSLAATLFRLVTGAFPFPLLPGVNRFDSEAITALIAQIERGLPNPDPRCSGLPQALEQLIRAGLAGDPSRRPELPRFLEELRGTLNQSLADSLKAVDGTAGAALVQLHIRVSRQVGRDTYQPVASRGARPDRLSRNMKKVPPPPEQVLLRTGDRVRIEVLADQTGYVTVFNVGPTGDLNLLFPEEPLPTEAAPTIWANQPLHVLDVEMEPPPGKERLFAVWSRRPLLLTVEELHGVLARAEIPVSEGYRATRNMVKMKQAAAQLPAEEWQAVVVEVEHSA